MNEQNNSLDKYIKNLNETYMTIDEQKTASVDELIESNLRYVVSVAHQYKNMGLPLDDLIQEGNVGLIEASEKFDNTVETKFITFAVHYIKMRIRNALTKKNSVVKQSNAHVNKIYKIDKVINEFRDRTNREPNIEEIADITEMSPKVIQNAMGHRSNGTISINAELNGPNGSSNDTLEKIITSDEMINGYTTLKDKESLNCLRDCLEKLSEREKYVITHRYLHKQTLQVIGDNLGGMTPAGVKSVETRGLSKLRELIESY